jgi:hypothetical protein
LVLSNIGLFDNSSVVLESWLVPSEMDGKKRNMGLAAAELLDVTTASIVAEWKCTVNSET